MNPRCCDQRALRSSSLRRPPHDFIPAAAAAGPLPSSTSRRMCYSRCPEEDDTSPPRAPATDPQGWGKKNVQSKHPPPLPRPRPTSGKSLSHLPEGALSSALQTPHCLGPAGNLPRTRRPSTSLRWAIPGPGPGPGRGSRPAPRRPPPEFSLTSPTLLRGPDSTSLSAMLGPAWNRGGSRRGGGGTSRAPGPRPHCSHGRLKAASSWDPAEPGA